MVRKIEIKISELMSEAGATPMELIRSGMAQGTAYNLSRNKIRRIDLDTLLFLCIFFSDKLGREISPGDIISIRKE